MLSQALSVISSLTRVLGYAAVVMIIHQRDPFLSPFYALVLLSEVIGTLAQWASRSAKKAKLSVAEGTASR